MKPRVPATLHEKPVSVGEPGESVDPWRRVLRRVRVFERRRLGVALDRRRAGTEGALLDHPRQDLRSESCSVRRVERKTHVVSNNFGDSIERVVAEGSVSELSQPTTNLGVPSSVAVDLDARHEGRADGSVDLRPCLGLPAEIAAAIVTTASDQVRCLSLRCSAGDAAVCENVERTGRVPRVPNVLGHVRIIRRLPAAARQARRGVKRPLEPRLGRRCAGRSRHDWITG